MYCIFFSVSLTIGAIFSTAFISLDNVTCFNLISADIFCVVN